MVKKLSVKITISVLCIMAVIIGSVSIFYVVNCKELYIKSEKGAMSEFFNTLVQLDFEETKSNEFDYVLENYDDKKYKLVVYDENRSKLYSSDNNTYKIKKPLNALAQIFADFSAFSAQEEPQYKQGSNGSEHIFLKKTIEQNGKIYYVYVEQSLKTADSVFAYANRFLVYMILLFMLVCGLSIFIFVQRITRPAAQLSDIALKISSDDYSTRYTGKITNDELGVLAANFNDMADTIQDDINRIKNYNFLLKEDIKRMTEYDSMRRRVLSNITHELKTPLAIISSQIEMLSYVTDDEKRGYYHESAMKEIDSMSKLISNLLNFSSGEKEIFVEEEETVDLSQRIGELTDKMSAFFFSKGITYEKQLDENCVLEIMPNHVDHVFNNYAMNAAHHVKKGGKIRITLKNIGEAYRLSIYNDGENISEENLKKIWSDFYKYSENENDYNKTSGLGLFIVKEISIIDHTDCGVINRENGVEFWYDFKGGSE